LNLERNPAENYRQMDAVHYSQKSFSSISRSRHTTCVTLGWEMRLVTEAFAGARMSGETSGMRC